jgi:Uncharacterized protein conserved in archaea (DUF2180)
MNCYVCDAAQHENAAVAICQHCGVALCREHLGVDLLMPRARGMTRGGCAHAPLQDARAHRALQTTSSSAGASDR